jgi:signal transduction histidine kinase
MTDSGHKAEGSWQPAYSAYDTCTFSMDSEGLALAMCQHQHPQCHALGTLAGGIAHDLNNTLHAVLGYAELLMEDTPPDSLAWRHLQQVVIASTRAKDLVQHMLQVSRQQEQARGPVQLAPVIDEVLSLLHASCPVTVTIRQTVAPWVGAILADSIQMYQVVLNLCLNAIHAMHQHGGLLEISLDTVTLTDIVPVHLGTLQAGLYVRLRVRDTGDGIAAETLPHIFEPFFTTKAADEGMGMGLTVVQSIVRRYSGAIQVTSTPGKGSTFTLYFPAMSEARDTLRSSAIASTCSGAPPLPS